MGGDFFVCFISIIIDAANYNGSKFGNFILNLFFIAPIIGISIYLLLKKRKKQFLIAGFLYLIGGGLLWVYKMVFFVYLIVSDTMEKDYSTIYNDSMYLLSFLINLLVIFDRLAVVYLIRGMFPDIEKLEVFIHEREHAELVQSLGVKRDERLCEDEEITEENLYNRKNNPFFTGREKKKKTKKKKLI